MNETREQVVHSVIEYVKMVGVDFDAADVEEDVLGVLYSYGFWDGFPDEYLELLRKELLPLGLLQEVSEIALKVQEEMENALLSSDCVSRDAELLVVEE